MPELFKAITAKGYNLPTPIQRRAIPIVLQGYNVIAMARTGSGKTGAFCIPIVQRLKSHSTTVGARCVILSPTREIAIQTATYFRAMAKNTDLTSCLITGGKEMENQFERLLLNPDVIIATPGRFMHCLMQTGVMLSKVEMVVYDECDRLFEMGFAEQLKSITACMPASRQSLLFSATISEDVRNFTLAGIKDYRLVQVDKDSKLSEQLKIHFFVCRTVEKEAVLMYILRERVQAGEQTIVFGATKYHVEYMHELCSKAGLKSTFIYGAMD
jgi:ATP-dependent RNA helicase DDX54/DBP10